MEYYGLRTTGSDIDLIASEIDVVNLIKKYPNKWKPGRNNGRAARVYYNLPVVFKIS